MQPEVKSWNFDGVSLNVLDQVASTIIKNSGSLKIVVLHGEMGAGKTTLVKAMAEHLGVSTGMSSPTFSIVNEYETADGRKVYHFDFYRLKNETEAYDIGVDEYFDSGNYCFIEWAEKIPTLLPQDRVDVYIKTITNTERNISFSIS
jgi:tRNA threonylcarbamoyladenosine biosynthesis protein TsaE